MKQYIVENGIQIPLCAVIDNNYVDYLTGQVIENKNTIKFIQNGLLKKTLKSKKMEFEIQQIITVVENVYAEKIVGYNYVINGCTNYLDINKKTMDNSNRQFVIDRILEGKYKLEVIWE